jgi:hypothetical protein
MRIRYGHYIQQHAAVKSIHRPASGSDCSGNVDSLQLQHPMLHIERATSTTYNTTIFFTTSHCRVPLES